jgi:hypothetical protein
VTRQAGGLEGRRPSKLPIFRLLWATKSPTAGEKEDLRGRRSRPRTPTAVQPPLATYDMRPVTQQCQVLMNLVLRGIVLRE